MVTVNSQCMHRTISCTLDFWHVNFILGSSLTNSWKLEEQSQRIGVPQITLNQHNNVNESLFTMGPL